ncbi:Petal formation-expressed [Dillenia turbinata]|uniref:Petal formation-expressed n=1 Tax=Dillenia turbinata TaxID=194707 RepID=A0AAN8UP49_9MAGN
MASSLFHCSSSSCFSSVRMTKATIQVSKLKRLLVPEPELPTQNLVDKLSLKHEFPHTIRVDHKSSSTTKKGDSHSQKTSKNSLAIAELYAVLEAVADRAEMHANICEQRINWNTLLLDSINMVTLSAATMAGIAALDGSGAHILALKLSSTLLYSAATGMLLIMNKIQPSQLAEEQRNAVRLFKRLHTHIQKMLALQNPSVDDVQKVMEEVLALDRAYPLPLLGVMLEKFPKKFEPAVWWPNNHQEDRKSNQKIETNGWSENLEVEMGKIVEVMKNKDSEDYRRLGNLALKINKTLATLGPMLTGIGTIGSVSFGSWGIMVGVVAGALACIVNTLEHGGQVGMVFEMYRNCGGFFKFMEVTIESMLKKSVEERENGELFEMKVALELGRSLSELRELAASCGNEFASKLF